ncbi:MAG: TIGR02587 family membrane protein [Gemmatimonadaceae bacterium]
MTENDTEQASALLATPTPRQTLTAYGRGVVGGLLVGMPSFMTMEIWWGGFTLGAARVLGLLLFNYGVLLVLQHYSGLHPRKTRGGQIRAALVAYALGLVAAALVLVMLGITNWQTAPRDFIGKIALLAVPVSIGASVAMSEFGQEHPVTRQRREAASHLGTLGMAAAGAMLFGFGVAPTDEPMIIGLKLPWHHALALVVVSLVQVHAIVYSVGFRKSERDERGALQKMLREGVGAYATALVVAAYLLWTFGRIDGDTGFITCVYQTVALGFVTSLGAAAGELLL